VVGVFHGVAHYFNIKINGAGQYSIRLARLKAFSSSSRLSLPSLFLSIE
jgi:hypothetical protein